VMLNIFPCQFQFPLHRDPRCNEIPANKNTKKGEFQFPLHRDPRCNRRQPMLVMITTAFQFPLHRDPRCNCESETVSEKVFMFQFPLHRDPRCNPSCSFRLPGPWRVSVPFTSGSSLQLKDKEAVRLEF